jgi:DNA repair protein RadD
MGFHQLNLVKSDVEIVSRLKVDAAEYGIDAWSEWVSSKNSYVVHFVKNNHKKGELNPLIEKLKENGLFERRSGSKFIPDCYKTGTFKDRLEILAGLMDTDGSLVNNSGYDYVSKSAQLARDVAFVARSLGFTVSEFIEWKNCQTGNGDYYNRLHISGDVFKIPCVVPRKKAVKINRIKNHLVSGFSISSVGTGEYFGFTLDGNHRYLTSDFFIHHNCGKSLLASNIVNRLDGPCLIFQPTREILEQNFEKFESYGERPAIYSASMGEKTIGSQITLATIGSVIKCREKFRHIKYIIQDECHIGNPKAGMYKDFYNDFSHCKILGLTATPVRLYSNSLGSELRWITRTAPKIFNKVVSVIQIQDLAKRGYFAPLEYKQVKTGFNPTRLRIQKNGADYTDESVKAHFLELHFSDQIVRCVNRLFELGRSRVLIFTRFVEEAEYAALKIPGSAVVTGQTPKKERIRIISEFKSGKIPAVFNVGVLTCGFDYPELSNVILARPTMSLTLYYQMTGRCVRPHPSKSSSFVIDMVGLSEKFGRVEDLQVGNGGGNKWFIHSNGKQLTNVYFPR